MKVAGIYSTFSCKPSALNLSPACVTCRDRHLKCSGGPVCGRCTKESTPCVFKPSRRGQRRPAVVPFESESHAFASTTCVPCRERHLKCSGGPLCTRCAKDGIPCLSKRSRRGQRKPTLSAKVVWTTPRQLPHVILPKSFLSSCDVFTDPKVLRSFMYFREKTSPELSANQDHSFWNSRILQFSHDQPAIKHLLAAVGALHEALEVAYSTLRNEDAQPLRIYALKQQGRGIRLINDSHRLPFETILISSILLICFEALQRSFSSMINTLRVSLRVLMDWHEQSPLRDEIIPAFSRVSMQASTFLAYFSIKRPPCVLEISSKDHPPSQLIELPKSFTSLLQAGSCLDSIMMQCCIHQDPVVFTPDYELTAEHKAKTQALLGSWHNILSNFLNQAQQTNNQFPRELVTLKIKYHVAYITTSHLLHMGELRFDNYLMNFEIIISLSIDWLALNGGDATQPEPVRCNIAGGEHNAGIISGLMLCALHCRCPVLRRRAVGVLTRPDCRSDTAAKVAEHMIALEEQGLNPQSCKDIPHSQRVRLLRVSRPTGVFSPYDQPGGQYTADAGIWHIPRARANLRFAQQPQQLVLGYVKAPCDVTGFIEEMRLDL